MKKRLFHLLRPVIFVSPVLPCLLIVTCTMKRNHDQQEIEQAMRHYDSLLKKMDADSISRLFTPDGELSPKYRGRDSIRQFLSSFGEVKPLTIATTSDSVKLDADTAVQDGHYAQSAAVRGKDTIYVEGTYHAQWVWLQGEGWRIKLMSVHADNYHQN